MSVANIEAILEQATPEEVRHGASWYQDAHAIAASWANKYEVPMDAVVGVIGALSPCVGWERNLADAKAMILAHVDGEDPRGVKVSAFGPNKEKAALILEAGTREGFIGGQKVTDFCNQIEDPSRDIPVIDRHAYNVWAGERVITKGKIAKRKYLSAAQDYQLTAEQRGVPASQVQATVWLVWRRMNA